MDGLILPQQVLICLTYGITLVCSGLALYGTARRFLTVRSLGWGKAILFLTFGISTGMVIWVGDPNLLYVFPLFVFFFHAQHPRRLDWTAGSYHYFFLYHYVGLCHSGHLHCPFRPVYH